MELTPNKLKALCEVDWSAFAVGWPLEVSLDKTVINEIYGVIEGKPGYPDQFPYIDCWQDAVLSWPTCLKFCLEDANRIMLARVATTSKCREEIKEPILTREPKELPLPYVPLYPPLLPVPHPHLQHWIGKLKGQSHL
jgi:hypothetical protein